MVVFHGKHRPFELLRLSGIFIWICTTVPLFFTSLLRTTPLADEYYVAWWVLQILFVLVYWHLTRYLGSNMQFVDEVRVGLGGLAHGQPAERVIDPGI